MSVHPFPVSRQRRLAGDIEARRRNFRRFLRADARDVRRRIHQRAWELARQAYRQHSAKLSELVAKGSLDVDDIDIFEG